MKSGHEPTRRYGAGRGKGVVYGNICYWKCMLCPGEPRMCLKEDKHGNKLSCALDWHTDDYFCICRPDQVNHFNEKECKCKKPTKNEVKKNAAHIKAFRVKRLLNERK